MKRPVQRREPVRWRSVAAGLRMPALLLGAAALVVGTVIGGVHGYRTLLSPEQFPVQAVHFDSELRHLREADLRSALEPRLGSGFWGLDVNAVRESLEALPWVRRAKVRRVWPGTLQVTIREHRAVSRWNADALLSDDNVVFRPPADTWPSGLPELVGPESRAADVGARYLAWKALLGEVGLELEAVKLDARESWRLRLANGAHLELGRQDMDARLRRFAAVVEGIRDQRDERLVAVDLRYPNGFAVRWESDPGADN